MVEIQKIETILDFTPKRIKKHLFLWCSEGNLAIEVDNKLLTLFKNQVLTITSGQYHCFKNTQSGKDFFTFIQENPRLLTNFKDLMFQHYTTDIFNSEIAKAKFLEPELLPFN